MPPNSLRELKKTLRQKFHIRELRPGQEDVIRSVLAGENTLTIMPTGGGKSLCYQLPALQLPGTTIIVSPLISLMKDQREKLTALGLNAIEFNSVLSTDELRANHLSLKKDSTEFIFVTPEQLENPEFLKRLQEIKIDFVVIDEAHCISQWGHDFRPAYLGLAEAIAALGQPPVLALTATATPRVVEDIQAQLNLAQLNVFRQSLMRENLHLAAHVLDKEEEKRIKLLELVRDNPGSGIVYASTVRAVRELEQFFRANGRPALIYHGKLKASERERNQNQFIQEPNQLMIATNAFGMGIDKADIRFVVHNNFPGSLESYYQEAGRAGRDGQPATCTLLYLKKDKSTQALFLARKYPSAAQLNSLYKTLRQKSLWLRAEIVTACADLGKRKTSVLLSHLKQLEVLSEKKRGEITVKRDDLSEADLGFLSDQYGERGRRDQDKLKRVIMYAQTALCRWHNLAGYFEESIEWHRCDHCDNDQRDIDASKYSSAN